MVKTVVKFTPSSLTADKTCVDRVMRPYNCYDFVHFYQHLKTNSGCCRLRRYAMQDRVALFFSHWDISQSSCLTFREGLFSSKWLSAMGGLLVKNRGRTVNTHRLRFRLSLKRVHVHCWSSGEILAVHKCIKNRLVRFYLLRFYGVDNCSLFCFFINH